MAWINFSDLKSELALLARPGALNRDYWLQSPGIFLVLNLLAIVLVRPLFGRDDKATALAGLFLVMSLITAIFAHMQEPNTFIPMLMTLFAIYVRVDSASPSFRVAAKVYADGVNGV